ncbi:MAG: DMT family transporter [Hahellaceae bacterium]|nr:DMT family transporter [Hahellaceae bacterium]
MPTSSYFKLFLALFGLTLTSLFWAGNALVARGMTGELAPLALSFWRWAIPSLYLLPFSFFYIRKYWPELKQKKGPVFMLSLLGIGTYNSVLYTAATQTTAINLTLVSSTLPFGTLLCALLILRARPSRHEIAGAMLSCLGALTILSQGDFNKLRHLQFNPGDTLMIVAMLCWSLYSVLFKKWSINIPAMPFLTIMIPIGTLCILPFYLVDSLVDSFAEANATAVNLWPEHVYWSLAYVATLPSVMAYWLWNRGVQVVGPGLASIFSYLIPVFTAMLSVPILSETLELYHGVGGLLTLGGLVLASWSSLRQTRS